MKKSLILMIIALVLLSSCTLPLGQQVEEDAMATKVSEIVATSVPPSLTPILIPTLTNTPAPSPTAVPTDLPTPEPSATSAPAPTDSPTAASEATNTPVVLTSEPIVVTNTPTLSAGDAQPTLSADDYRAKLGAPSGTDPMDSAFLWNWPTGVDVYTTAAWENGVLNLTGLKQVSGWRMPYTQPTGNLYVEMTANSKTCSGEDSYGIIFRIPELAKPDQGYLFGLTCDGRYGFWRWDGRTGKDGTGLWLIQWKTSDAIVKGANQTNRLGVLIQDSTFKFYINGKNVAEFKDTTFKSGFFGAFVNPKATKQYTVGITQFDYWLNAQP